MWRPAFLLVLTSVLVAACGSSAPASPPDRAPGDRAPLTAACDPLDTTRCSLPWPSNTFTVADPTTATGLRVSVQASSLPVQDDPAPLELADGFSTATGVVAGFNAPIDPASLGSGAAPSVRLIGAQPGTPGYAKDVPLRSSVKTDGAGKVSDSLVVGFPRQLLEPASDYVVVVLDSIRTTDGKTPSASRATLVALGRKDPASDAERRLRAYHAPTRSVLEAAGVKLDHVLRVWDFTTRSASDAAGRLRTMRSLGEKAVSSGATKVAIDVVTPGTSPIAVIVEGRITNVPTFIKSDGTPSIDDSGQPVAAGVHDAPFRAVIPEGSGSYPVVMYAHGNGGDFHDPLLDTEIAASGLAKVGIQINGWDDTNSAGTLVGLARMYTGSDRAASYLVQALADEAAIEQALAGSLGDALAQPTLGTSPNPAAGRRPDVSHLFVAGGSLGGSLQAVQASADPDVDYGVLNVSGAGWTRDLLDSEVLKTILPLVRTSYASDIDLDLALLQSQGIWDIADDAAWGPLRQGTPPVLLLQESIGDPVAPNPVTELLASVAHAVQVEPVLVKIDGLQTKSEADGQSGLMQFKVAGKDPLDFHAFAARDTPAGKAARQQIGEFLVSALKGAPRIVVPSGCSTVTPQGNCDFSQ